MANETKPAIRPEAIYCPKCGAVHTKGEKFCNECGASLLPEDKGKETKSSDFVKPKETSKKPFYKKKSFVVMVIITLFAAGATGGYFWWKTKSTAGYETRVKGIWQKVVQKSEDLDRKMIDVKSTDDFAFLSDKIQETKSQVEDAKSDAEGLNPSSGYEESKKNLVSFLNVYKDYLVALQKITDDYEDVSDEDIDKAEDLGKELQTKNAGFEGSASFVTQSMPSAIFEIGTKLKDIKEEYVQSKEEEEASEREAAEQTAKDAQDKKSVEDTATGFMNAYIAGDAAKIKNYMTTDFQNEFNYDDLSDDSRQFSYPDSFRITESSKNNETQYTVKGRELDKSKESDNQWAIDRTFIIKYSGSKWLIDSWSVDY